MHEGELQKILNLFDLAQQAEKALGELYSLCGRLWPEHANFWERLAKEEQQHAETVGRMSAMIREMPERFETGRLADPSLFRAFLSYLERESKLAASGQMSMGEMLEAVRDIEQSVIDVSYPEFVTTDVGEYVDMGQRLVLQTMAHRQWIVRKIAETKSRP